MLEGREYVPLLHARLAEIRALRELPDSTKNLFVPVVKLRPWLNAKELSRAVAVVEEAVGERLYGFDLDESKYSLNPDATKVAHVEFSTLFDPHEAFRNYYDLVAAGENRIPVYRNLSTSDNSFDQLEHIISIDRGVFVKINVFQSAGLSALAGKIKTLGISNAVFVIDCGWGRDILSASSAASEIAKMLIEISDDFEIVIAGSSFPQSFSGLGERFITPAIERALFAEVRRQVNYPRLIYGDWGSTRPPSDPVPMRNIPRIDTARADDWVSWRSEDDESYVDIAERAVKDAAWDGKIGVWGEYMILATAAEEEVRIKSPAMAAAVRVNLHLHQQANFDKPDAIHIGDEIVGDDL